MNHTAMGLGELVFKGELVLKAVKITKFVYSKELIHLSGICKVFEKKNTLN